MSHVHRILAVVVVVILLLSQRPTISSAQKTTPGAINSCFTNRGDLAKATHTQPNDWNEFSSSLFIHNQNRILEILAYYQNDNIKVIQGLGNNVLWGDDTPNRHFINQGQTWWTRQVEYTCFDTFGLNQILPSVEQNFTSTPPAITLSCPRSLADVFRYTGTTKDEQPYWRVVETHRGVIEKAIFFNPKQAMQLVSPFKWHGTLFRGLMPLPSAWDPRRIVDPDTIVMLHEAELTC